MDLRMFFPTKKQVDHAAFSSVIATKTPLELHIMRKNLTVSQATNKDAKIRMVEKRLASLGR